MCLFEIKTAGGIVTQNDISRPGLAGRKAIFRRNNDDAAYSERGGFQEEAGFRASRVSGRGR